MWHPPQQDRVYCEDTRPQNWYHLSTAQEQQKTSAPSFKEPPLPSTPSFWEWAAPSTIIIRWSLMKSWVLILKELRNLLPSFMFILSITLPNNLSTPSAHLRVLLSTLHRSPLSPGASFRSSLRPSWFSFSLWWRSFTVPNTKVAPIP